MAIIMKIMKELINNDIGEDFLGITNLLNSP